MFMMAIPASNMVGAAVAAALMRLDWLGWGGWRWLLILEPTSDGPARHRRRFLDLHLLAQGRALAAMRTGGSGYG